MLPRSLQLRRRPRLLPLSLQPWPQPVAAPPSEGAVVVLVAAFLVVMAPCRPAGALMVAQPPATVAETPVKPAAAVTTVTSLRSRDPTVTRLCPQAAAGRACHCLCVTTARQVTATAAVAIVTTTFTIHPAVGTRERGVGMNTRPTYCQAVATVVECALRLATVVARSVIAIVTPAAPVATNREGGMIAHGSPQGHTPAPALVPALTPTLTPTPRLVLPVATVAPRSTATAVVTVTTAVTATAQVAMVTAVSRPETTVAVGRLDRPATFVATTGTGWMNRATCTTLTMAPRRCSCPTKSTRT